MLTGNCMQRGDEQVIADVRRVGQYKGEELPADAQDLAGLLCSALLSNIVHGHQLAYLCNSKNLVRVPLVQASAPQ